MSDIRVKRAIRDPIPYPDNAIIAVTNAKYQPIFFGINRRITEATPINPINKRCAII